MAHHDTLRQLFVDQLRDLYWTENHSLEIWPTVAAAATDADLKEALDGHIGKTYRHVERLKRIFDMIGEPAEGTTSTAMEGLAGAVQEAVTRYDDALVRDAALINAIQRMEHYEMSGYSSVQRYAEVLGYREAAKVLQETLDDESEIDEQLTKLATGGFFSKGINQRAAAP